jgi:hypothetical protein
MLASIAQCFSFGRSETSKRGYGCDVVPIKAQKVSEDEQSTIEPESLAPTDEIETRRWSLSKSSMDELNEICGKMSELAEVRRYGGQHIRRGRKLIQHTLLREFEIQ